MISHEFRFIFIHINKCGGTSIEKAFDPDADRRDVPFKHDSAEAYRRRFPDQFRSYFKFSFVRNPWDWLVSRYFWSANEQQVIDYSFRELLHRLQTGKPLSPVAPWLNAALQPQIRRLTVNGRIAVDFVGRFENLQGDFDKLCRIGGLPTATLPHVFKTEHDRYTRYYDAQMQQQVAELFADDIGEFGYTFGD